MKGEGDQHRSWYPRRSTDCNRAAERSDANDQARTPAVRATRARSGKHRQNDGLERGTLSARLRLPGHTPDVRVTLADSAPPTITFMLDTLHGEQQHHHRQLRPRLRPRRAGVKAGDAIKCKHLATPPADGEACSTGQSMHSCADASSARDAGAGHTQLTRRWAARPRALPRPISYRPVSAESAGLHVPILSLIHI